MIPSFVESTGIQEKNVNLIAQPCLSTLGSGYSTKTISPLKKNSVRHRRFSS